MDYPADKPVLVEALQILGRERNSLVIRSFLSEHSIPVCVLTNLDESQTSVGPLTRISLKEAYIILGLEENLNLEDADVMAAYTHLVLPCHNH
jgi:A repeated domain in UCH-protein